MNSLRVVLIGAGNVAWNLAQRAHVQGIKVLQVYSRKKEKAFELAQLVDASAINDLAAIDLTATCYILAVSDSAIASVVKKMREELPPSAFVVHTSGATPLTVLQNHFAHCGVLYPLQSFSKTRTVDFSQLPLCLETARPEDYPPLEKFAYRLSQVVHPIGFEQRQILHLAAVFVNNFVNHLYHIGETILEPQALPFSLLLPLIQETAAKVKEHAPLDMQTGPAIRRDETTISRHLALLADQPELQKLYTFFSTSIQKNTKHH
jgi:predicted short-subunit dehydrogenase-like oxidoreductase (DUF2520 family)